MDSWEEQLWQFAQSLYAREGVAEACLALQDRCGIDVCLLLTGAWLGRDGYCWRGRALSALLAVAREWRPALGPLRQARRALRQRSAVLYGEAKQLELAVEQAMLTELARTSRRLVFERAPVRQAVADNLRQLALHCPDEPAWAVLREHSLQLPG